MDSSNTPNNAPDNAPTEPTPTPTPTPRRWLKIAAWTGGSLVALAAATAGGLWWWTGTEGSLATTLGWVQKFQPLRAEKITGSLRAGGHIDQLQWQQDGLSVLARDVNLAWQPQSLRHAHLQLDQLSAAKIEIHDQRPPSVSQSTAPPNAIGLPLRVTLASFAVGQLDFQGASKFSASGIGGRYTFNGVQHQLDLKNAQVANGTYSARATLASRAPLKLEATLSGALAVNLPNRATPVPLTFQATASGPLTELALKANLQATPQTGQAQAKQRQPHASATARVMPWAAQPLPQADAEFRDVDMAALWPNAPQTLLTGSAKVRPSTHLPNAKTSPTWLLDLQLANALPGPWNQQKLPLERLNTQGEWRNGTALVRNLSAQLGGGELLASGDWHEPPATSHSKASATAEPAWTIQATLKQINPAQLDSQLGAVLLDGQAKLHSQGTATQFEASLQAAGSANTTVSGNNKLKLTPLHLRDAKASGNWNPHLSGGTLALSMLQVRTDEAELNGQLDIQPTAKGGQGTLTLTAPGLEAKVNGELRETSGSGELSWHGRDAAQALRWLQKFPGLPMALQKASTSGSAELQANWKGGWQDPVLQVRLDAPSLDWQPAPKITATATPANLPSLVKIRALQTTLAGRLSQAQLNAQGRIELNQRRYALQLGAQGGRLNSFTWQGLLEQFSLSVEDPALGAGAWRLATHNNVPFKWTHTKAGGAFESGAGEAVLSAPAGKAPATPASQATLAWQPVRWRPGELITAGKLTGLPVTWIELVAGPQLASAGLGGNLVLDGAWDAVLSDTLKLKANLSRSSGDIMVLVEGAQGNSARVAAGIKQARLSLENVGEALSLAVVWDSERAGSADGQLKTRLAHAPVTLNADGTESGGGWLWPMDAPLNGQLRAQLPRLGLWSLLAPPGWRLRGSFGTDISINGTHAAPNLSGNLQANDVALRSVVDGIEFGNGRLRATLDGTRMRISEFTLQGAGDKGTGGQLSAQGEAGWIDGKPQVQFDAKLQKLRASIRTDRQVTVSGDVQAKLQGQQAELTGKLAVDQARIFLPDESAPQLGDDVVVRSPGSTTVGQQTLLTATNETSANKASQPIKLAVQLDLGQDFQVKGKGIDTLMRGTLTLNGSSLNDPRLNGTIRTSSGQYQAYGQRLDIERGVLRFTGSIDNPTLNILAVRPNLTQRVGVQITGTALLPSVRLYAQPELTDAEKLSWLIVGRPAASGGVETALLQQAALALLGRKTGMSGGLAASLGLDELSFRGSSNNTDGTATGGAVTLGKRFSRNFYAAYESSLSGALGTLYVFYELSRRFTVRAQAGEQSAVDLIFTIPYD